MTVYVDSEHKCHVADDGTMTAFNDKFFDGKCPEFVEGYMVVLEGKEWVREDGEVFEGLTVFPCVDYSILEAAQRKYELEQLEAELADAKAALELLGVTANEVV